MKRKTIAATAALLIAIPAGVAALVASAGPPGGTTTVMRGDEPVTEGSGRIARQARTVAPFTKVVADDGADVSITFGSGHSVAVEADDNLIHRVTTRVENGTLRIGVTGSYRTRATPRATIVMPLLAEVQLHASGEARIAGMRGQRLMLSSNGSGDFDIDGDVEELEVELFGSGAAELAHLRAQNVRIELNGSSDARVNAARSLRAEVNGSGNILYAGSPAQLEREVNGSGTIRPLGR